MYSVWLSDEEQRLWRDHLKMVGRLQAAMHRQLHEACGMTLADYDVLVALSEQGRVRINDLVEALGWEQSRLSHQLRRMRSRGLVARFDSAADGRGGEVDLTDQGRAQLRTAAPGHAELVRAVVFEGMTAAQNRALQAWTARVLNRLESQLS
jgi:DNA-binding MarR family transcriptional regulator